ncbi:MAG: hypothetical protein E7Z97_07200 [Propionibacteriaceae bacterium]|nr:hypothetical protein [Propionibacteriaceae bacterium]
MQAPKIDTAKATAAAEALLAKIAELAPTASAEDVKDLAEAYALVVQRTASNEPKNNRHAVFA